MIRILVFFLLCVLPWNSHAQKMITSVENDSSLVIIKDSRLDDLINKQAKENLEKQSMSGYRVQIYFGGNRQKASEIKLDFNSRYPEVNAYLSYQQPNYKVRVGDYRSRFEARKFLSMIEGKYPTTFVVQDDIKLPSLK